MKKILPIIAATLVVAAIAFVYLKPEIPGKESGRIMPAIKISQAPQSGPTSRSVDVTDGELAKNKSTPINRLKLMSDTLQIPDSETRKGQIKEQFSAWCRVDPEAATRWAAGNTDLRLDSDTQAYLMSQGLTLWANKGEPRQAADFATNLRLQDQSFNPIDMVTTVWAMKDVDAAKAYIDQMTNKELQPAAMRGLVSTLASKDPVRAAQLSQLYGSDSDIATNGASVAQEWAKTDFNAAWNWANSMTGNRRGLAVTGLTMTALDKDPQAAAQWAASLPPSEARSNAIGMTAMVLSKKDPETGANWINTLPSGDDREFAASSFVDNNRQVHPSLAAEMAATLTDPAKRKTQLDAVLKPWLQTQPDQAKKWLAANPSVSVSP